MPQLAPIIGTAQRRDLPDTSRVTGPFEDASAFGVGRGVSAFGANLDEASDSLFRAALFRQHEQNRLANFNAETGFTNLGSDIQGAFAERVRGLSGDANGFTGEVLKDYDQKSADWLQGIPEKDRPKWQARVARQRATVAGEALRAEFTQRDAYYRTTISEQLDKLRTGIDTAPQAFEGYRRRGDEIIDASGLPEQAKAEFKTKWANAAAVSYGTAKVRQDPDAVAGSLGGDTSYFRKLRRQESGDDPAAANPSSSARGPYQFLDATWTGLVNSPAGQAAGLTPDGRTDPKQAEAAVRIYTSQSQAALTAAGLPANERNLYLLHFLGQAGGVNFLKQMEADPNAPAAIAFPAAAQANPRIFLNGNGTSKSLSDVFEAQTKNFSTNTVTKEGADIVLDNVPADQRNRLREMAEREIVQRDNAQASQAHARELAQWNALQLDIVDGKAGRADVDNARRDGWLTDASQVERAYALINQREKKEANLQYGLAKLGQDGATWNPYDKKDRDAAEAVVAARGGDPGAAFDVWDRTGVLAKSGAVALRGALVSPDPTRVTAAAQIASNMMSRNPNAFAGVNGQSDIEKAGVAFDHYVNRLGYSAEDAGRKVAQMNDPAFKEKNAAKDADFKKLKDTTFSAASASQAAADIFDSFWNFLPWNERPKINPAQRGAIAQDYVDFAAEGYRQFGDPDLAKSYAEQQVKRIYGVSNGNITAFPPERAYPPSADPADPHGYIYRQALGDFLELRPDLFGKVTEKNVALVPLPGGRTTEPWRNGQPAPYNVVVQYTDEDGYPAFDALTSLRPGSGFVADPKMEAAITTAVRAAEFDAARTALSGRNAVPDDFKDGLVVTGRGASRPLTTGERDQRAADANARREHFRNQAEALGRAQDTLDALSSAHDRIRNRPYTVQDIPEQVTVGRGLRRTLSQEERQRMADELNLKEGRSGPPIKGN